ncbi:MAG TPA: arylesterase [Stellaceae bacterium]|jgi:acyl-CoA thioesterase-1
MRRWFQRAGKWCGCARRDDGRGGGSLRPYGRGRRLFNAAAATAAVALLLLLPAAGAAERPSRILALGDSLTAGYGLPPEHALPVRLQAKLKQDGIDADVINAGVSGDTSAGGLARLDWALADKPDIVIVELGANDVLRGIDPRTTYDNLDRILAQVKAAGAKALLVGMLAPANWGADYRRDFDAIYPALAKKYGVPLDPFVLDGVITRPELLQADGMHPTLQGVDIMASRLAPYVERLTRETQG